jgi:hypothetical protein
VKFPIRSYSFNIAQQFLILRSLFWDFLTIYSTLRAHYMLVAIFISNLASCLTAESAFHINWLLIWIFRYFYMCLQVQGVTTDHSHIFEQTVAELLRHLCIFSFTSELCLFLDPLSLVAIEKLQYCLFLLLFSLNSHYLFSILRWLVLAWFSTWTTRSSSDWLTCSSYWLCLMAEFSWEYGRHCWRSQSPVSCASWRASSQEWTLSIFRLRTFCGGFRFMPGWSWVLIGTHTLNLPFWSLVLSQ